MPKYFNENAKSMAVIWVLGLAMTTSTDPEKPLGAVVRLYVFFPALWLFFPAWFELFGQKETRRLEFEVFGTEVELLTIQVELAHPCFSQEYNQGIHMQMQFLSFFLHLPLHFLTERKFATRLTFRVISYHPSSTTFVRLKFSLLLSSVFLRCFCCHPLWSVATAECVLFSEPAVLLLLPPCTLWFSAMPAPSPFLSALLLFLQFHRSRSGNEVK